MKNIPLLCLTLLFGQLLYSQTPYSNDSESFKVDVSVRAGLNGATLLIPESTFNAVAGQGYSSTQAMKLGGHAGLAVHFVLSPHWNLQTGLHYHFQRLSQTQSSVYTDSLLTQYSISSQNSYKTHRLRLPIIANYVGVGINHLVVGAGLYFDIALSGQLSYDASAVVTDQNLSATNYFAEGYFDPFTQNNKYLYYTVGQDDFSQKYTLYNGNLLRRFDVGVCLELGYQISEVYVGLRADFGLLNMANPEFMGSDFVERNFSLLFNIGYKIN